MPSSKRARDRRELPGVYHDVSRNFAGRVTPLDTVQLRRDAREHPTTVPDHRAVECGWSGRRLPRAAAGHRRPDPAGDSGCAADLRYVAGLGARRIGFDIR